MYQVVALSRQGKSFILHDKLPLESEARDCVSFIRQNEGERWLNVWWRKT